jgi:lysophospholipase L1-like esterase
MRGPGLTSDQEELINSAIFEQRTNVSFASPLVVDNGKLLIPAFDYYSARTDSVAPLGPPNSGLDASAFWAVPLAAAPGVTARIYHDLAEAQAGNVPFLITTDEPFASSETKNIVALYRDGKVTPMQGVPLVSTQSGGVVANQVRYGKTMDRAQRLSGQSSVGDIADAVLTGLGFTRGVYNAYTLEPVCGGDLPAYDAAARGFARCYQQTSANFSFAPLFVRFYDGAGALLASHLMTLERVLSTRAAASIWRGVPHPQAVFWRIEADDTAGYTIGLTGSQFAVGRDAQWILRDDYPVPVTPPVSARKLQIVSTRFNALREFVGTPTHRRHDWRIEAEFPAVPTHGISLVFGNYFKSGGLGEFPGYNQITLDAAAETISYTPSTAIPIFANGRKTFTLDEGAILVTDPVQGLSMDASSPWIGGKCVFRGSLLVPEGGRWPQDYYRKSPNDCFVNSNSEASQTYNTGPLITPPGGIDQSDPAFTGGFGPIAAIGYTEAGLVSAVLFGDSIPDGAGDSIIGDGFIARALANVNGYPIPYSKLSRGSDTLYNNTLPFGKYSRSMLEYATISLIALGGNDIAVGRSLSDMKDIFRELSYAARGRGVPVAAFFIGPRTFSPVDRWASLAGQTYVEGFEPGGIRDQFNAWLANYADGLADHVCNPYELVESLEVHGKWNVNGVAEYPTKDGTHPSEYFQFLMSQPTNRLMKTVSVGETERATFSYASMGAGMTTAAMGDALRGYGLAIETGSVAAYQMREALQADGRLQDIIDALPADPTNPISIRWTALAPIKPGDQVASFIASALSYNSAAMDALFASAASL